MSKRMASCFQPFSILDGSSVGPESAPAVSFQYPRRIECGCGFRAGDHDVGKVTGEDGVFGNPFLLAGELSLELVRLAVTAGDGDYTNHLSVREALPVAKDDLSVSSADRVWVWLFRRTS